MATDIDAELIEEGRGLLHLPQLVGDRDLEGAVPDFQRNSHYWLVPIDST